MENASKALIIAGAILLSIMIIGLGITIFNGVRDQTGTDSIKDQKIITYNQKFEQYEGTIKGSEVKTLLSAVIAANGARDTSVSPAITVVTSGSNVGTAINSSVADTISTAKAEIKATASYKITLKYSTGASPDLPEYNGYVKEVSVKGI